MTPDEVNRRLTECRALCEEIVAALEADPSLREKLILDPPRYVGPTLPEHDAMAKPPDDCWTFTCWFKTAWMWP
jgi:hypothetical protein